MADMKVVINADKAVKEIKSLREEANLLIQSLEKAIELEEKLHNLKTQS